MAKKLTLEDLSTLTLASGNHPDPESGMCLLEATALFAGESFSDHPTCVDPVIAAFGRAWNDGMRSDEEREQLKQYIPLIVGTRGSKELSERRAWMATDWLIRVHTAAWLALSPGLAHHAEVLRALPPITCTADAVAAQPKINAARSDASAARAAARAAAGAAAWAAAWDAAGAAARAAARAAAVDTAWAAARAAAVDAAWAAARESAREALEPTVKTLQASAHELFARMIRGE